MAKFCTRCGTPLEAGFRYCDECGKPVGVTASRVGPAAAAAATRNVSVAGRPAWLAPKVLKIGGGALAVLCVVGVAAYFLTREASLPQGEALAALLANRPEFADIGCLEDFAYAKNPVQVSEFDSRTRRYLDYLVSAGVYAGPRVITQQTGFFTQKQFEYTYGPAATKFIRHGKLCIADGFTVTRTDYGERVSDYGFPVVPAHIVYALKNPAPWSTADVAGQVSRLLPARQSGELNVPLKYEKGHWAVMSREEGIAFAQSAAAHSQDSASGGARGWFSGLLRSDPGEPLYGRWTGGSPLQPLWVEFSKNSVSINGSVLSSKLRYTKDGDQILISESGSNAATLKVQVLSRDRISLDVSGHVLQMQRSQ